MLTLIELAVIGGCLGFLFVLTLIEGAMIQSSPVTLRMIVERKEEETAGLLREVLEDPLEVLVPLHLGTQISLITVAILTAHLALPRWPGWGLVCSFFVVLLLSLLFRQLLPRLLTQNRPEEKLVRLLTVFGGLLGFLASLARPVSFLLQWSKEMRQEPAEASVQAETTEEEIQAYLEIGEDEGIIEEEDSKLIQSVVEFGDTLVREVMTPRPRIIACEEAATLRELRDLMVRHRHSRIPVFRGDLDHVLGIAYIRHLLARYSPDNESEPAGGIARPALFVPETKPVSVLMRELQERGDHAAMVVDEFGAVSGLVTMEDLLEEIVGEIRDEDQARSSGVTEEAPGVFVLRGSTELERLEELTGRKLECPDYSTVAGLIAAQLGRVPATGEEFEADGLRFQIVDADRKRVRRARVRVMGSPAGPAAHE